MVFHSHPPLICVLIFFLIAFRPAAQLPDCVIMYGCPVRRSGRLAEHTVPPGC